MRFVFSYKGTDLLWEVVKETQEGVLCRSIDGIRNGFQYFGCGAEILFPSSQVAILTSGERRIQSKIS